MAENNLLRLAVSAGDIPRLKQAISQLSADLAGQLLIPGDRLLFNGMLIEVLQTEPGTGLKVDTETEVKIRTSEEPVSVACATCGQDQTSSALQCDQCGANLPLMQLGQAAPTPAPPPPVETTAAEVQEPKEPEPVTPEPPQPSRATEPSIPPPPSPAVKQTQTPKAKKGIAGWVTLAAVIIALAGGTAWWFLDQDASRPKFRPSIRNAKPKPLPKPKPAEQPYAYLKKYDGEHLYRVLRSDAKLADGIKKLFGGQYDLFKDNFQTQGAMKAFKHLLRAQGFRKHRGGDSVTLLLLWFDGGFQALVIPPKGRAYYFGPPTGQGEKSDRKITYLRKTWQLEGKRYTRDMRERARRCLPKAPVQTSSGNSFTNSIGMKFVLVPAGSFVMGASPQDKIADKNERPLHRVELSSPFLIQTTEVTRTQWIKIMGTEPWKHQHQSKKDCPQCPATHVTWEEAKAFAKRLNLREGWKRYKLPTEAQWEYAARAGGKGRYGLSDSTKQLGQYAWYKANSTTNRISYIQPVAKKKPNAWGLYDTLGNADEICLDYFQEDYYRKSPQRDPKGPSKSKAVAVRGGDCATSAKYLTVSRRSDIMPCANDRRYGFRLIMSAGPGGVPEEPPKIRPVPKWRSERKQDRRFFNSKWKTRCQGWDGPPDYIRLCPDGLVDHGGEKGVSWRKMKDMSWWVQNNNLYVARRNEYEIYRFPPKPKRSELKGTAVSGYFYCRSKRDGRVTKCWMKRVSGGINSSE